MTKRRKSLFKTRTSKKIGPNTRLTLTKKGLGVSTKIPGTRYSVSSRTGLTNRGRKKDGCAVLLAVALTALGALVIVGAG